MDKDLYTRLQRVEDRLAIQELFNQYASHLDAGEFGLYASLFSARGEVKLGPMGRARGREAIEALMVKSLGEHVGKSYHIISNPIIHLDGDRATSQVMWTVILRGDNDQPVVGMIGSHRDELIREQGQWLFLTRTGYVDIPSAMPGSK